jgi:hypothetical protein
LNNVETDTDAVTDAPTGDLATVEAAEREPRRQGTARKAVPLTVVKKAVAAMQAEDEKVSGPRLAERLGCSARSGYRYLGEVQSAAWVVGLTSKIHLAVEQGQKPLSVVITAGQRGDSPQFERVLEAIRVPRLGLGAATQATGPSSG